MSTGTKLLFKSSTVTDLPFIVPIPISGAYAAYTCAMYISVNVTYLRNVRKCIMVALERNAELIEC